LYQTQSISEYIQECALLVENYFKQIKEFDHVPNGLKESMAYSFLAGGKRLRPVFVLAAAEAVGGNVDQAVPAACAAACAVEMIHTYSLIHDDLPAMDDDDFRRGKPTNHKVYGEAMAILAGDGLLTHAFYVLAQGLKDAGVPADRIVQAVTELSLRAGMAGMVGGQVLDLQGEKGGIHSVDELMQIHLRKTSDLVVASLRLGGYIGGASPEQLDALTRFGHQLGLAFQIQDDILDVIGNEAKLGKKVGGDARLEKATYPKFLGLDGSKKEVERLMNEALSELQKTQLRSDRLTGLAGFILHRES
jgi:geranylgeranyl diphosphate synthase type II